MNPKDLRKQLRNIVQELLTEALIKEVMFEVEKRLMDVVKKRLDMLDERQKDMLGYIVRQSAQQK